VLTARASYDSLSPKEQAIVRANWDERMRALRKGVDLTPEFTRLGRRYAELDAAGRVVVRTTPATRPARVTRLADAKTTARGARTAGARTRRR
jgi:hypothetical protein